MIPVFLKIDVASKITKIEEGTSITHDGSPPVSHPVDDLTDERQSFEVRRQNNPTYCFFS